MIGLFVPIVALIAAVRLARPDSPWAHWRYDETKLERAATRFDAARPAERVRRRLGDVIAGRPSEEVTS